MVTIAMLYSSVVLCLLAFLSNCSYSIPTSDLSSYLMQRQEIIAEEHSMYFGSKIVLDEIEQRANNILMKYKYQELKSALKDPRTFLPSRNFLRVSRQIEQSKVYQAIKRMPKAGVLHAHLSAITSHRFIVNNITRRSNLYICRHSVKLQLRFFKESENQWDCHWELLDEVRKKDGSIDEKIGKALTMFEDDPYVVARGVDDAWRRFENIFNVFKSLVTYRPVYEDFLYHLLEELYEDNVQFVEIRTGFPMLYELNGYKHSYLQVIGIYNKVVDRFTKDHPDFLGVKWIYSRNRNVDRATFAKYIRTFRTLRRTHPNLVVGFDLIGQEDKGHTLKHFIPELLSLGAETQFFFHAGETNWNGLDSDENLVDAVLLNAKRIGHGYALLKHPVLMDLVEKKRIAIEISPISNQVLKLVKDLRNHPASYLFAHDLPLIVSSDDPGFWGAQALSFDFYETFVGIMSGRADLRALKQLAINSIEYSSLNDTEKFIATDVFNKRWRVFVHEISQTDDDD